MSLTRVNYRTYLLLHPARMLGDPTWWRTLSSGPPTLLVLELGGSSVAEAPEESMEMLSELVDRETEIPEENI